ncbi:hypothetical protein [Persicitalea sp.]|uniref:hypothetical protein n=1 Tax=Persicitalea sp. TaxID=3100273 RepID=UPI0035938AEF
MKNTIKDIFRPIVVKSIDSWTRNKTITQWNKAGRPAPPPHIVKQNIIQEFQRKTGYSILIETGTYVGEMVEAQKSKFEKIISIELGQELAEKARDKFVEDRHISIVQGDSGKVLPSLLKQIDEPAILWLDGHYSEGITAKGDTECPIFEELEAIFTNKNLHHLILIDDARLFTGEGDYPSIKDLTDFVKAKNSHYTVKVEDDIIRAEMGTKQ